MLLSFDKTRAMEYFKLTYFLELFCCTASCGSEIQISKSMTPGLLQLMGCGYSGVHGELVVCPVALAHNITLGSVSNPYMEGRNVMGMTLNIRIATLTTAQVSPTLVSSCSCRTCCRGTSHFLSMSSPTFSIYYSKICLNGFFSEKDG